MMEKQTQNQDGSSLESRTRQARRLSDLAGLGPVEERERNARSLISEHLRSMSSSTPAGPRPQQPPYIPVEKQPQPYSLRAEKIKELSDEKLMQYLTRESVPQDGVLDEGAKMAITMELMRRQSAKLAPKSWRHDRNYLAALAAAVLSAVATAFAVLDFFSK
ncbi:hypothetical protein [Comamonas sp. MYb69]|uniref:hypothetical protein n=1 Tax=Comamonas sp. MYb69 TaxID=1848650 RepID=UPI0030A16AC9